LKFWVLKRGCLGRMYWIYDIGCEKRVAIYDIGCEKRVAISCGGMKRVIGYRT